MVIQHMNGLHSPLNVPTFLQQVGEVQRNLVHLLSSKPRGMNPGQNQVKLCTAALHSLKSTIASQLLHPSEMQLQTSLNLWATQ